jgi:hypothetical protein
LIDLTREAGNAAKQQIQKIPDGCGRYLVGTLEQPLLRTGGRHFGAYEIILGKVGICFEDLKQHNKIP